MPAGLGRVDSGNHWHIVKFGQRDRRMSDQPVMRMHHVGLPRAVAAPVFQRQPRPNHRVAHGQRPGHHVAAEGELMRVLRRGDDPDVLVDLVRRRVGARVGARGTPRQHHDVVAGGGQCGRQVMDVPAESTDHHRRVLPRHHQDFHRGSLRASSAPNRPSARFQPSARRCANSRRPEASAPAISRVAWACRCAR